MEPVIQTPTIETPVAPPIQEAAPKSELQQFREKKAAPAEPAIEPKIETPAAEPAPIEAPEPPPTLAAEHVIEHEGVKYDKRTRAGKEIVKLKGVLKASEQRIYELQDQLRRTQPAPKVEPKAPAAPVVDPNDPEPTLESFADQPDPYLAYTRSLARWEARQENKQLEEKRTAADRARQQEESRTKAQADWDAKVPEITQRYPDFPAAYDAVFDSLASVAQTGDKRHRYLVHRLLTSEHGHELTYFLGKHPDEVSRLYQVKGFDEHVLAIGRLEERVIAGLAKPPAVTHQTTPAAPMAPVGGGATTTTYDPKTANLAQFRANKPRFGMRG